MTCSNSKKSRETVAAFRLHLVNPPLRLPPYPRPASFRTSPPGLKLDLPEMFFRLYFLVMGCNVRCSCRICLRICLSFVASWDASLFLPQVWLVLSLYQVLCLVCSTISSYVRYDCRATSTHGVTDLWCLQAVLTDIRLLSEYFGQKQIRLD